MMITAHLRSALGLAVLALAACDRSERPAQTAQSHASSPPAVEASTDGPKPEAGSQLADMQATRTPSASSERAEPNPGNTLGAQASSSPTAQQATPADAGPQFIRTPDVIYVPTPQPVVDKMLEIAKVKKSDVVYDLGCGDGRIVVTAAKRYGTKAYGFDIDPARVAEARANVRAANVEDLVTIEQKDIFTLDLSPASVVTLYLLPELNVRLLPQLEQLKPGSRVVSHDFNIEGTKPIKHLTLHPPGEENDHEVYLWKTPIARK